MADLEAHAELVSAIVEQEDGKDAIWDEGANEFGGAGEKGLQIERGVERIGEAHEIGDVGGLDACVDGVKSSRRNGVIGGTIVAFQFVRRRRWRSVGHLE